MASSTGWILIVSLLVSCGRVSFAFAPIVSRLSLRDSRLYGWEEWVYRSESMASDLASVSLNHADSLWTSFPILYGAGLLTSVSPCVWGLLPLTMSYISQAAGERRDKQATIPTLVFALGLATVFCTFGVVAASVGQIFGSATLAASSLLSSMVCLAMGFQLLEFVRIPVPNLKLFQDNNKQQQQQEEVLISFDASGSMKPLNDNKKKKNGGSLLRTFLLGGSSALVASPCATPVLTSILAFVAKGSPLSGAILLFGYTMGYATPLLLVAASGGQFLANLPKNKSAFSVLAPWVTPLTGGILLWYGTNGVLTALLGDPSTAGMAILE